MNLTNRQIQIVKLICDGYSSKQIAFELGYTVRTVESYRKDIMNKLNVHNTARLIVKAIELGIYEIEK